MLSHTAGEQGGHHGRTTTNTTSTAHANPIPARATQHELIHAHNHDTRCCSIAGLKAELRARRKTALTLISPVEYQLTESAYDGEAYSMADAQVAAGESKRRMI